MNETDLASVILELTLWRIFLEARKAGSMVTKNHDYLIHGVIR